MTKLELKEWITELACSLDRGDLKIDELMNEVEEIVDKNVTEQLTLTDVVKSLRDEMAISFAQTKMQVWDSELTNKHREKVLEDWLRRNGEDLTIAENIVKDAYFLADEMIRLR
jgi:phosphotransacetylase